MWIGYKAKYGDTGQDMGTKGKTKDMGILGKIWAWHTIYGCMVILGRYGQGRRGIVGKVWVYLARYGEMGILGKMWGYNESYRDTSQDKTWSLVTNSSLGSLQFRTSVSTSKDRILLDFIYHWRSPSIEGCLPSKVIFHQGSFSIQLFVFMGGLKKKWERNFPLRVQTQPASTLNGKRRGLKML